MAMAITVDTSCWHYMQDEAKLKDIITENLNYFVTRLEVWDFIPELKARKIFTTDDEERVESQVTTTQKIDHLVRHIERKGLAGWHCFFDVLQYDYPDFYAKVTKQPPLRPPTGWFRGQSYKRRSIDQMQKIEEMMKQFIQVSLDMVRPVQRLEDESRQHINKLYERLDQQIERCHDLEERIKRRDCDFENLQALADNLKAQNNQLMQENNLQTTEDIPGILPSAPFRTPPKGYEKALQEILTAIQDGLFTNEIPTETVLRNMIDLMDNERRELRKVNVEKTLENERHVKEIAKYLRTIERQDEEVKAFSMEKDQLLEKVKSVTMENDKLLHEISQLQTQLQLRRLPSDSDDNRRGIIQREPPLAQYTDRRRMVDFEPYPLRLDLFPLDLFLPQRNTVLRFKGNPTREVAIDMNTLKTLKVIGGNHSGTYLDCTDVPELRLGDRVWTFESSSPYEKFDTDNKPLDSVMHFMSRVSSPTITVHVERTNCAMERYNYLKSNRAHYSGDMFCVTVPEGCAACEINPHDILLITNTMYPVENLSYTHAWQGYKLNPRTGAVQSKVVLRCDRHLRPFIYGDSRQQSNVGLVETIYVQPMKAKYMRPVCILLDSLFCLIEALPSLEHSVFALCEELPFNRKISDYLVDKGFPTSQVLMCCSLSSIAEMIKLQIYPLIIVVQSPNTGRCKIQEGLESMPYAMSIPKYLWEIIQVDAEEMVSKDKLAALINACINMSSVSTIVWQLVDKPTCPHVSCGSS